MFSDIERAAKVKISYYIFLLQKWSYFKFPVLCCADKWLIIKCTVGKYFGEQKKEHFIGFFKVQWPFNNK